MYNSYMQEPPKGLGALYFRILQIMKQTMKVILNSNELGLDILICNVTTNHETHELYIQCTVEDQYSVLDEQMVPNK